MVYKNIDNTASFASEAGIYSGSDNAIVIMESDEYTFVKTANPENWSGTDPLTYTITLTNETGVDLTDITVTDILPPDVTFVPGSVEINGVSSTNYTQNLPTIVFGTTTLLSVTSLTPLEITFQVEKATP